MRKEKQESLASSYALFAKNLTFFDMIPFKKDDKYFILLRGWENTYHYTWQLTLNITYELYHQIKTEDARNLHYAEAEKELKG